MNSYKLTVGLEVHAELKTATKMFCGCRNAPDEYPQNTLICPVCLAHPGTLPVPNKKAIELVLAVGEAVSGEQADFTEFDRKNYFYPDIPKGYQISQYQFPLIFGGNLAGVELERIHLEEDTARSIHTADDNYSKVDFNRAGVPLLELVTKPTIRSAEQAHEFARELRLLLRYLGASDADMEKGQMRIEANISVSSTEKLGTKVEVKNLNSFRSVERAIEFEYSRQSALLLRGENIVQETRGWDEGRQVTFSQRKKENSHDYRYFPDPDIPKVYTSEVNDFNKSRIAEMLPELPNKRRIRYQDIKLAAEAIDTLVNDPQLANFYDQVIALKADPLLSGNYLTSDFQAHRKNGSLDEIERAFKNPDAFAQIIQMISDGSVSSRGAKDIILKWFTKGGIPAQIAKEEGLIQVSDDSALVSIVSKVIEENPAAVLEFKSGKEASLQFLVGQAMRHSKGSANPSKLQTVFRERESADSFAIHISHT